MAATVTYRNEEALPEGSLLTVEAHTLLHGCVAISREGDGWVRPWRFEVEQVRAVGSCLAWHPGLYRQMARTTAGVCIEFETDASEVVLEVMVDAEPNGTRQVLEYIDGPGVRLPHDGVSADVDGRHIACRMPEEGVTSLAFTLDDVTIPDAHGMLSLPGLGTTHHVRIWLPALRGCTVRSLITNGTFVDEVPSRPCLLVFGDSIAQGFVTDDPAHSWPVRLATSLGLDLVNQGIGGQVFQSGTLFGIARSVEAAAIAVAFGENYRYEPCLARSVARDIRSYLMEVARIWPDVSTYVLTPLYHDEERSPSHSMSCWHRVPSMLAANAAVHDSMTLADGLRLLDHDDSLFADADGHPNARGAEQMARRLHLLSETADVVPPTHEEALALLDGAPRCAFPLAEALRRGIGHVLFAREGCVLLDVGDDQCILYAPDGELGADVVSLYVQTALLGVLGPQLDEVVMRSRGFFDKMLSNVAVYRRSTPVKMPVGKEVRPLDESFEDVIHAHYNHPGYLSDEHLKALLRRGDMLGGFEDDELVGFVGEHPEGSIGLLKVFEGHRRNCWGRALESAKINQMLERGQVPWCEIFPSNVASLSLQRSLGLTIYPAEEMVYYGLPDYD